MYTLLFLLLLGFIVIFWLETLKLREHVILRCQRVCREANLQLLDQTVALVSLSIRKGTDKSLHICRRYQFEVSEDGVDRHFGYVNLSGRHIISIQFDGPSGSSIFHQSSQ